MGPRTVAAIAVALTIGLSTAPPAEGVTRNDFLAHTTKELVTVCTTPESDPMYQAAMGFCLGYGVGAYHYYAAVTERGKQDRFVCLPDPPPKRIDLMRNFVTWAQANPTHMDSLPVETLFRYLSATYPCQTAAAPPGSSAPKKETQR